MTPPSALLAALISDAALLSEKGIAASDALADDRANRTAWFAGLLGPLAVVDSRLADVSRSLTRSAPTAASDQPLPVSVVVSGGAGGLISLSRRDLPGVSVVAVEAALRDLDDLSGNAARVAAAADELDDDVRVFVEIPYAASWERAVAVVEAAGRYAKVRTGGADPTVVPPPQQVARQLSVLIEADLPFSVAVGGLRTASMASSRGVPGSTHQYGVLSLLLAIDALIDGADEDEAAHLLAHPAARPPAGAVNGWDDARSARVRRRLISIGGWGVREFVDDLVRLGLVAPSP